ncbi:MAG: YggT family protein [Candidatus Omnitrophica bacterium]|nr:YggT family protein [Candidatus Omnitrophota bacterium]
MFIITNFLLALLYVFDLAVNIYVFLIVARVFISWVNADMHNPVVQFIVAVTDIVLEPIRRLLPSKFRYPIDISPMVACFILIFLRQFLTPTVHSLIVMLR